MKKSSKKKSAYILCVVAAIVAYASAEADGRRRTLLIGEGQGMQNLADALARSEQEHARQAQVLDEIQRQIEGSDYSSGMELLQTFLKEKEWDFHKKKILNLLVRAKKLQGDWEKAIQYQRELILYYPEGPWTLEYISQYWKLLEECRYEAPLISLEEKIPTREEDVQAIRQRFIGSIDDNRNYFERIAGYYLKHLHFDVAEQYAKRGLAIPLKRKGLIEKERAAVQAPLHRLLRNMDMLQGKYAEALKENEWLQENETIRYLRMQDIPISGFLEKARRLGIDPKKVMYHSNNEGALSISIRDGRKE